MSGGERASAVPGAPHSRCPGARVHGVLGASARPTPVPRWEFADGPDEPQGCRIDARRGACATVLKAPHSQ
eukprot:1019826-Alexandrium_andersonii.AAC.1